VPYERSGGRNSRKPSTPTKDIEKKGKEKKYRATSRRRNSMWSALEKRDVKDRKRKQKGDWGGRLLVICQRKKGESRAREFECS